MDGMLCGGQENTGDRGGCFGFLGREGWMRAFLCASKDARYL